MEAVVSLVFRKVEYYKSCIIAYGGNQKQLYAILNSLMGQNNIIIKPTYAADAQLASDFSAFFDSKISCIRGDLDGLSENDEFSVDLSSHFEVE